MLYLGIDIGKARHVAALISPELLTRYSRFDACPTLSIENGQAGFTQLLAAIGQHATPQETHVLLERTGHYGQALEQFLQDQGCHLYRMQAASRYGHNKTDEADARALAALLYNEVELHAQPVGERLRISPLIAPSPEAQALRGMVRHRYELSREVVRRKNKLTAILDELFPEFVSVFHDPFCESALTLREQFPTPRAIAEADLDALCATRKRHTPSRAELVTLQKLARETIGTRNHERIRSLLLEQRQLIAELRLMQSNMEEIDAETTAVMAHSRAGQILMSFSGIGAVNAAKLLASIGTIANFTSIQKLRNYFGWSPRDTQTGTSMDSSVLSKGGNPMMKQTLYLITLTAIRTDPTWKRKYVRLVERKCAYDGKRKAHLGKMKVIGHIAGQIIGVLYTLLRRDYDVLASLPEGVEPPPPELYNPARRVSIGGGKAGGKPH